jgi:hypothetical protein
MCHLCCMLVPHDHLDSSGGMSLVQDKLAAWFGTFNPLTLCRATCPPMAALRPCQSSWWGMGRSNWQGCQSCNTQAGYHVSRCSQHLCNSMYPRYLQALFVRSVCEQHTHLLSVKLSVRVPTHTWQP